LRLFEGVVVFLPEASATVAKDVPKKAAARHENECNFMKFTPFVKTTNS
jgi:hypothetical protein